MTYEYHVIPAPTKGRKTKGAKSSDARYAAALADVLNSESAQGWEFVRAEVLPCSERQGLTGSRTVYVNVLVFRRPKADQGAPALPAPATEANGDGAGDSPVGLALDGVTKGDRI